MEPYSEPLIDRVSISCGERQIRVTADRPIRREEMAHYYESCGGRKERLMTPFSILTLLFSMALLFSLSPGLTKRLDGVASAEMQNGR